MRNGNKCDGIRLLAVYLLIVKKSAAQLLIKDY